MGFVFDISVAVACLTGPLCALTSLTIPLVVRTAGEDVKGSVGDRCVAGGEGCPMARSRLSRLLDLACVGITFMRPFRRRMANPLGGDTHGA